MIFKDLTLCGIMGSENLMIIWSIESTFVMIIFESDSSIDIIRAFMNLEDACLLRGHLDMNITLWME